MKTNLHLCIGLWFLCGGIESRAQTTAFTYHGQLEAGGSPVNGNYDFRFVLYDAGTNGSQAGPIQTNLDTSVAIGLFTAVLDFGAGVFDGTTYWLDIAVRTNGVVGFTELTPRQQITSTPYAIFANTASQLAASGTNFLQTSNNVPVFVIPSYPLTNDLFIGPHAGLNSATNGTFATDELSTTTNYAGQYNVLIGAYAGYSNVTGSQNTFVGEEAGRQNQAGDQNTFVGFQAGLFNTNGWHNTAIGAFAGQNLGQSSYDVFIGTDDGPEAPYAIAISNCNNVGVGTGNFFNLTSGSQNVGLGTSSLATLSSGSENTCVGNCAGQSISIGWYNVLIGGGGIMGNVYDAALTNSNNVAVGYGCFSSKSFNAANSVAMGYFALESLQTGTRNTAIGFQALQSQVTGADNTALGYDALNASTQSHNTAMGQLSLYQMGAGTGDTAIGDASGRTLTAGSNSTFIGSAADVSPGAAVTLSFGTAIGAGAIVGANNNIKLGRDVGTDITISPGPLVTSNTFTLANSSVGTNVASPSGTTNLFTAGVGAYTNYIFLTNNILGDATNWVLWTNAPASGSTNAYSVDVDVHWITYSNAAQCQWHQRQIIEFSDINGACASNSTFQMCNGGISANGDTIIAATGLRGMSVTFTSSNSTNLQNCIAEVRVQTQ